MTLDSRSSQHGTHNAPRTSLFRSFHHSMRVSRARCITICINYSHFAKYSRPTINDVGTPRGRIQISRSIIYIIGPLSRISGSPFVNLTGKKSEKHQKKIDRKTYVAVHKLENTTGLKTNFMVTTDDRRSKTMREKYEGWTTRGEKKCKL